MIFKEAKLSLEVVLLLIGGMTMLITGALLFQVSAGVLPYYENGLYGVLLTIVALQMITLGKTPIGDMRRSKQLLAMGVMIAVVGIITCVIPILNPLPLVLLVLCFGPGSFILFLKMCFSRDKFRTWLRYGGIFWHLIFGCSGVYVLSMVFALILWKRSLLTLPTVVVVACFFGAAILYLAWVLQKIYSEYPAAEKRAEGDVELSTDQAMLMLMSVFMLLLGVLLIPVSLGLLPFSVSAQLGLLMVIFAVQMLASGSTPIGPFPGSWPVILVGLLFAALGIVSCIIPEILVSPLTVLVGILNILNGVITLVKICVPRARQSEESRRSAPPVIAKLFAAQLTMNLLAIMFGISMLIPGLVHGLLIGLILAANGCVLLYLLSILVALEKLRSDMGQVA